MSTWLALVDQTTPPADDGINGFWAYVVAVLPAIALILTPLIGLLVAHKNSRTDREKNLMTVIQQERDHMQIERDEAIENAKKTVVILTEAQDRVREHEEAEMKLRIQKLQDDIQLEETQKRNQVLSAELESLRPEY